MSRRLTLTITPSLAGLRVDTLLKGQLGLSGTVVRRIKWLSDGILVDGSRVTTRFRPQSGQLLSVRLCESLRRSDIVSASGPLDIVYEDADLIVLNKAPGVSVHPGPGHFDDTLGNFLLYYYDQSGIEGDFHPIHRLDRGTSGLMVVAKHPHAQEVLKGQLHTDRFFRGYLAVCQGVPTPTAGCIDAPIGPVEGSLLQRQVCPAGKQARTRYHLLAINGTHSLVQLELETGRTHQIRVHMAHIGHPLIGDFLYGVEVPHLITRPALHSHRLCFVHPITGEALSFCAPLPADIAHLMQV